MSYGLNVYQYALQLLQMDKTLEPELYANRLSILEHKIKAMDDINAKCEGIKFPNRILWLPYSGNLLILACEYQNYDLISMLLTHGASVNDRDSNGNTPLIVALVSRNRLMSRDLSCIQKILKYKPKLNKTGYSDCALTILCESTYEEDLELALDLIENYYVNINQESKRYLFGKSQTAFTFICRNPVKNKAAIRLQEKLVELGGHLNRIDTNGAYYELHMASKNGHNYLVHELLKAKASIHWELENVSTMELIIGNNIFRSSFDLVLDRIVDNDYENGILTMAFQKNFEEFINVYISKCVVDDKLEKIYRDKFTNAIRICRAEKVSKTMKRLLYPTVFVLMRRNSVNRYIAYKIIELLYPAAPSGALASLGSLAFATPLRGVLANARRT